MEFGCNSLLYPNVSVPNVAQQLEAFGVYGWVTVGTGGITTSAIGVLFLINLIISVRKSPPSTRRPLAWITSMPMVISFLALMSFLIPRSADLCDTFKQVYMPFLLKIFIDLSLLVEGGQSEALKHLDDHHTPIKLCLPPCCCIGLCFRHVSYFSKKRMRFFKSLVYQAPIVQLFLIFLTALLYDAEVIGHSKTDWLYRTLASLNLVCFMLGMWGFNVLTRALGKMNPFLPQYSLMASLISGLILVLKSQNFILVILATVGQIPCIQPHHSVEVMRKSIDAVLTLVEAIPFGLAFFLVNKSNHLSFNLPVEMQEKLKPKGVDDLKPEL